MRNGVALELAAGAFVLNMSNSWKFKQSPGHDAKTARLVSRGDFLLAPPSPGALEALHRMNKEIDIRQVLPAVRVPTLILHGSEDRIVPIEVAQYMASRIPSGSTPYFLQ